MASPDGGLMGRAREVLSQTFGYEDFRPAQADLVRQVLAGRDVLGVMPTGAGKSIVYQVPAIMLDGLALVVSPLISLMKDQVAALAEAGVDAACINSSLTEDEQADAFRRARSGSCKLLYVAPERLDTPRVQALVREVPISLVAVDEAHCVSQWGQDFRPSYMQIRGFVASLPVRPPVVALTATATADVREDIVGGLGLVGPYVQVSGFDRPNLYFGVERPAPRDKLDCLVGLVSARAAKLATPGGPTTGQTGIVYCSTRKAVEEVCAALVAKGFAATRYHAGLGAAERRRNQDDFLYDRMTVMVATNAFGMGIDKSDVGFVIHYNMPSDLESYYQEAGRAGRDGSPADCVLIYNKKDVQTCQYLIDRSHADAIANGVDASLADELYRRDCERLRRMTIWCTTTDCLRQQILAYFGQKDVPATCDHCSNCLARTEELDVTVDAQKVLSCVVRIRRAGRQVGVGTVVDVLRGSSAKKIRDWHFDRLTTYGIMREESADHIWRVANELIARGWLGRTDGRYPTAYVTQEGMDWLLHGSSPLVIKVQKEEKRAHELAAKAGEKGRVSGTSAAVPDDDLFAALRALRQQIAQDEGVPAYIVFNNATLVDMAARRPHTTDELLEVQGVGEKKSQRYGKLFLERIAEFEAGKKDDE